MIESYLTASDAEAEFTERKSIFKAFVYSVKDAEQASQKLKALTKKFPDATHICYAYAVGEAGEITRSSDDGEPSGTAGQPILAAIKAKKLTYVLLAVVRYFGGIKLGAGGLVRAYSAAAAMVLQACKISRYELCAVYRGSAEYAQMEKISAAAVKSVVKIFDLVYNEKVSFCLALPVKREIEGIAVFAAMAQLTAQERAYFTDF